MTQYPWDPEGGTQHEDYVAMRREGVGEMMQENRPIREAGAGQFRDRSHVRVSVSSTEDLYRQIGLTDAEYVSYQGMLYKTSDEELYNLSNRVSEALRSKRSVQVELLV